MVPIIFFLLGFITTAIIIGRMGKENTMFTCEHLFTYDNKCTNCNQYFRNTKEHNNARQIAINRNNRIWNTKLKL